MERYLSFGYWVRRRRKALDLTQAELAGQVFCALSTIKKIELDERRPSSQLTELLANALEIPAQDRLLFLKVARGEQTPERLVKVPVPAAWTPLPPAALPTYRYNPVVPTTPLIGRETELTELKRLILQPDCRLLTLIGPGGVGKTHLALGVASACKDAFTNGVCFIPFVSITKPEFIVSTIINGLNLNTSGPAEPRTQLLNYLHEKELLLVLDNLEHLLNDISVLADILQSTPNMKLLVTSRERLNLHDEWVFNLHGLSTPKLGQTAEIEASSAVQLFLYAAQRRRFGFSLTGQNRDEVARICRLVDGMPLSLELAAAWTPVLSGREIADEIERNLDFLAVSTRDQPDRHRSLRAVFDHSWHLLSVEEQHSLRQLSVFRGSFGREAAEKVAGATLPVLLLLTDKSLLHRTDISRYELHELIRQYSAFKLSEADEESATRQRHFDYYLSLAESAAPHLMTADRKPWLDHLEAERDNLRTALWWSQVQTGSSEPMLRLAGMLYWYWYYRGYLSEGRAWLESALARADDTGNPIVRARALSGAGSLAHHQGDNGIAHSLLEESVALWRACGVPGKHGLAHALIALGRVARAEGDMVLAHSRSEEGVALFKEQDDRWGLAYALIWMGMVLRDETDFEEAHSLMKASVVLWRELGDEWGLAYAFHTSGLVALRQGDYEAARSFCEEALILRQQFGTGEGVDYSLLTLGIIALNQGNPGRAKSYIQQCQILFHETGDMYGIASALQYSGYLALLEGDAVTAQSLLERGLTLVQGAGPKWLSALGVARLAGLAAVRGRPVQAVRLWAAAEALMDATASYMDSADRIFYEHIIAPACVGMDEETREATRAEGRKISLEQAIQCALNVVRTEF